MTEKIDQVVGGVFYPKGSPTYLAHNAITVDAFFPKGVDNYLWKVEIRGHQDIWLNIGYNSYPLIDARKMLRKHADIYKLKDNSFLDEILTMLESKYLGMH